MTGIVGTRDTGIQSGIITCLLAFPSEISARDPQQRIEPIDGAYQLCGHLNDPVAATYVRKLVAKYRMDAFDRPRWRVFRYQHSRASPSPRKENEQTFVMQKPWGEM